MRDLLLGITPKDFDVATNALPDEVRRLFRNCRLIGRRFRLAHVHFGQEIIEVATFRAAAAPEREDAEDDGDEEAAARSAATASDDSAHRAFDTTGRILRDNIYGTIEEDVWRRDFTANGVYYNIDDFSIWDFVDGVSDVRARRLKLIGDPETRYREDPVRMLRAVRFAAKLDFSIEPGTEQPIQRLAYLLDGVPPARLFDECLKLFLSGFGLKSFRLLQQYGLFEHLFPMSAAAMKLPPYAYAQEMLELGLANTDARIAADKPVTPTFLFAILLWGAVLRELNERQAGPAPDLAQLMQACDTVLRAQQSRVAIPRRFGVPMRELLMLQPRFSRRSGIKSLSLLQHPRFRAAYDFLLLRAQAGVADPELAQQVVKQFLENALKYTPEDSLITISAERKSGKIVIGVADRGPGIEEHERALIFDRFYRGREQRFKTKGTGMGLAIAKGIVEAHGERIWVESERRQGSVFYFTLAAAAGGKDN